ncbi:MAG: capsular polysaccharide biosynthesis protein [Pseudomonadota bacterium]
MNLSFLRDRHLQRILSLAGHELALGRPRPGDGVLVWGQSPVAARGEAMAARHAAPVVRVEDAFLRSLRPGRMGDKSLGLLLDPVGVHFDGRAPSALEQMLASHPLDDSNLLARARDGMARLSALHLSKYNMHDPAIPAPAAGYVLVIDQTRNDASVAASGATERSFREMLILAQEENPRARVVIKTHPETALGLRPGHYDDGDLNDRVSFAPADISPHVLLAGAVAVYAVSSQLGFEAILAGHRPHLFGTPFYAGWGLSDDRNPTAHSLQARRRSLTRAQLFAAAMIEAPLWYDPCRDRMCRFEDVVDQLEAEVRAWRQDRHGHVATAMRLWKRGRLQAVFGAHKPLIFQNDPAKAAVVAAQKGRPLLIWAGKEPAGFAADTPILRVEDGFLRSRGLGAALIPPLSLVTDDLGIYYDPTRPSRLEAMIMGPLPPGGHSRAERLIAALTASGVTKYNVGSAALPALPPGRRILVPGQVEDDASILKGGGAVRSNPGLLQAAMDANPGAVILYKPHPDVEAGLRPGAIATLPAGVIAVPNTDAATLLAQVNEVWTMTSLLGFEALLRGLAVTTLGAPFYAGWGLTRDLGPVPARRLRRPDGSLTRIDLATLAHAALIAYPRYYDPVSKRPCPPEVALHRLTHGPWPAPGPANRVLSKLQGLFASRAHLWR